MAPYGHLILRVGLAGVLLWFGAQQLVDPQGWTGYIPELAVSLVGLSATTIVLMNGAAEVACGALLLLGLYTRPVAIVMAIHLALIAASLGHTAVAIRDWGLAFGFLALVFTGPGVFAIDGEKQGLQES